MKQAPEDCPTLEAVRQQIDAIDRELVAALAERGRYVQRAAGFKSSEQSVRASERVREALTQRRRWAKELGVSAELVDSLFRTVIDHFVEEELNHWKSGSL